MKRTDQPTSPDTPFFFRDSPLSLPLYLALEERILAELPDTRVRVQKTQISFSNRRNFAFASLLPARRAALRQIGRASCRERVYQLV